MTPSRISPKAVSARPIHCRRPIRSPKIRSAITASSTIPPASTAWTSDIGATDIAATWKTHAHEAIPIPIANSRVRNSERRGPQRLAHVDGRCRARSAVLVEEADVGRQGAGEREQDAEKRSHQSGAWSGAGAARGLS